MHTLPSQRADTNRASSQIISLISCQNFGWSATARKTWIFNKLAERNTCEVEENGEISPRALHVERKDLTSLFGRKHTIDEMISGGMRRNHGLCVAVPGERTRETLGGMCMKLKCAKMPRCE